VSENITFVGLDTHKQTISVVLAESGRAGEVRYVGKIANRPEAVARLVRRLAKQHGKLRFSYEAGPCGYGLYRQIVELGHDCVVAAPSLIPRRPGERVKTDRRDGAALAKSDRAGELVAVCVPEPADEAMRDLVRARQAAVETLGQQRQRLLSFLLRQGHIYEGEKHWTKTHRRWLAGLAFEHVAHRVVFQEALEAIGEAEARLARLAQQIEALLPGWRWHAVVSALQAMRGVALVTAATLVAEIGDFRRFANPRQLMAYLGLVPSEHSSGPRVHRGGITKAGNARVRRVLDEAAWSYLHGPKVGAALAARRAGLSKPVRDIAWKAQLRLTARFRHLLAKGKKRPVAVTAIAREMVGFLWAIAIAASPADA
jgi:transposase